MIDVKSRNVEEFMSFINDYSEKGDRPQKEQRFLKAEVAASCDVRLSHRSQALSLIMTFYRTLL